MQSGAHCATTAEFGCLFARTLKGRRFGVWEKSLAVLLLALRPLEAEVRNCSSPHAKTQHAPRKSCSASHPAQPNLPHRPFTNKHGCHVSLLRGTTDSVCTE
jgi:hypothetical protein